MIPRDSLCDRLDAVFNLVIVGNMNLIGNILWWIFGGLLSALGYFLGGVLLCITIIGIPFGLQSFRQASAVLAPFGKDVVPIEKETGTLYLVFNIVWIVLFGWEIALAHLVSAGVCAITIIGIPFALQHLKLIMVALFPFGMGLKDP